MTSWPSYRARFLVGRPGAAMARVLTPEDLADVAAKIINAYQRAAAPYPWPFHIMMLRHDGRWAEQLVQVGAEQDTCKTLAETMNGMRDVNAELTNDGHADFATPETAIQAAREMTGIPDAARGIPPTSKPQGRLL